MAGGYSEDKARLFWEIHSDERRGNGQKSQHSKLWLETLKRIPREVEFQTSGIPRPQMDKDLSKPILQNLLWAEGIGLPPKRPPEISSKQISQWLYAKWPLYR